MSSRANEGLQRDGLVERFFVVGHFETERAPQAGVEQVRRANIRQGSEHARANAGVASIEIGEQRVDLAEVDLWPAGRFWLRQYRGLWLERPLGLWR